SSGTRFNWHLELDGEGNNDFFKFGGTSTLPLSRFGDMIIISGGKSEWKEEKEDGDDIRESSLRDGCKGV
ncbi:hypothetical protein A2U01_0079917, partial [Trifolium medium]|nr:hypothetical protein [Trifolium medium]